MSLMRILVICGCCLTSLGFAATSDGQLIGEPKIFRTGLVGKGGDFAVSPDGARLVFGTARLEHGLRLIDLRTGRVESISMESGRIWEMPNWSAAGTQVVAISTAVQNNRYIVGDMQVILVDPATWKSRTISSGDGVKIFPMFSTDGKTVYYFKGKRREDGATPASRYDLYAIDLSSGEEARLTHEEIYQVDRGDEQGGTLLFSAYGLRGYPSSYFDKMLKRMQEQTGLYLRNNASGTIAPLQIDQGGEIFNFYRPKRDRTGNIYFITNTSPPRSRYKFWLCRASPDGKVPALLAEVSASTRFDIAKNSGEIYLGDILGDEIVFRRLPVLAEH